MPDLIFTLRDIYINSNLDPVTKFSIRIKYIFQWDISQMTTETIPIRTRTVINYAVKWVIPFLVYWKVDGN